MATTCPLYMLWFYCKHKLHTYVANKANQLTLCRSQWPRGLRRGSAAARFLGLWVRIPLEACMFVCCECCVLSGRGLCDGLITRPEESYRLWCVVVCDLETSWIRKPRPNGGCRAKRKKLYGEGYFLIENLISSLPIKKFHPFNGTWSPIAVFTRSRHLPPP